MIVINDFWLFPDCIWYGQLYSDGEVVIVSRVTMNQLTLLLMSELFLIGNIHMQQIISVWQNWLIYDRFCESKSHLLLWIVWGGMFALRVSQWQSSEGPPDCFTSDITSYCLLFRTCIAGGSRWCVEVGLWGWWGDTGGMWSLILDTRYLYTDI